MRQMENTITYIFLYVTCASVYSYAEDLSLDEPLLDSDFEIVRSPHDLDLGKRVYGYPSEYKRYPLYNFGLGKRSTHLYNFGLGKRSKFDEDNVGVEEYDEYNEDEEQIPELELYHDDNMQNVNKRQKLYSFGLGKRQRYNFGLGKRTQLPRYDFGLGKRYEPTLSHDKLYNFGLGKRNHLYSFGLGKRPYNQGPVPGRFNFGLGKRSENFDMTKNIVTKRDVHDQNFLETGTEKTTTGSYQKSDLGKLNKTAELESHEIMGHLAKSQMSKRSSYRYAFEPGKPTFRSNSEFSRQFRKPLYNFGLGKRMSLSKQSNRKNYQISEN